MKVKPLKSLVLLTVLVLIVGSLIFVKATQEILPPAIDINVKGQPTIGYPLANVHVVVFEEPKCPDCKQYNTTILPEIKKEFIESNKILYTVIPVSFLPHSMPAAAAWLCVYHQDQGYPNQDLFFKYVDYMYENQPPENTNWATDDALAQMAQAASPAIRVDQLKNCVEQEGHRIQVEKNNRYGAELMDGRLSTPTIYVDGIKLEDVTYNSLSGLIKNVLRNKGERKQ